MQMYKEIKAFFSIKNSQQMDFAVLANSFEHRPLYSTLEIYEKC
jgi:hypothetical protein